MLFRRSMFLILLLPVAMVAPARAQDMRPFVQTPDSRYFDFWEGTWYKVVNGKKESEATFIVTRGQHPASFLETWNLHIDSVTTAHATGLRAWDKIEGKWMYTWASDNGLLQIWEGRKFGDDWYITRRFDVAGDRYLSRQGWIRSGPNSLVRVSEKSYDDGKTWQPRFREEYVRGG